MDLVALACKLHEEMKYREKLEYFKYIFLSHHILCHGLFKSLDAPAEDRTILFRSGGEHFKRLLIDSL